MLCCRSDRYTDLAIALRVLLKMMEICSGDADAGVAKDCLGQWVIAAVENSAWRGPWGQMPAVAVAEGN